MCYVCCCSRLLPDSVNEAAPATTPKGWFSWWGGTKSDKPKPVRANLGEAKSSFYYDKELKRWVNGKVRTPLTFVSRGDSL